MINHTLHTSEVVVAILVSLVLAAWMVLTILNQLDRGRAIIASLLRYDLFSVIPIWTFFAPNPGRTDTHIVYRDVYHDGALTNWRALELSSRPGLFVLSHGERRVLKGIVDMQHELLSERYLSPALSPENPGPPSEIESNRPFRPASPDIVFTTPYLALLSLVTHASHDLFTTGTQFALATSAGPEWDANATVLFVSGRHAIAAQRSSLGDP